MSSQRGRGDTPHPTDWRERYEIEARKALAALEGLNETALLERVRAGRLDPYFAIWRALAREGTVEGSARVLWTFLRDHPGKTNMHHRYHCASALFRILGMDDPASASELRKQVQWDAHGEEARQEALRELGAVIDAALGAVD